LLTRSVERLAVSVHAKKEDEYGKECYGPDFAAEVFETHAFQHDATGDSQKVGDGEDFADHLRPGFDGFSPSQPPAKNSNAIAMQKMRIPLGNDLQ
jgi:hypothetical protein